MKNLIVYGIILSISFVFLSCMKENNDLTVVSISSLNGNIFPIQKDSLKLGGFSLISSKINEIREKNKDKKTEIIGNSNFIYGTGEAYFTVGKAVIELMNELNFSCLVVGHREFYFGFQELENLSKTAKFPFISANLVYKDSSRMDFIKPYIILKDNKTAVIGISVNKVIKANLEKDVSKIIILDPIESVKKYTKELKSKGITNIILAGDYDSNESSTSNLTDDEIKRLFDLEDIDLFLTTTEKNKLSLLAKKKPILSCDINGAEIASFNVEKDKITNLQNFEISSKTSLPDIKLTDKMAEIDQVIKTVTGKILGNSSDDIPHAQGDKFTSETPLGDLICDIMRDYTKTDIFLMNSGKVRKGFVKGQITLGDLYSIMPYEGNLVTIMLSGEQVIKVLESSCAFKMSKSFLQVSGISFTFDSSKKQFERVIVKSIKVNGKPLDKNMYYSVSLTDYIFQGGDSYTEFKDMGVKLVETHQKQMREIIKDYIKSEVTIGAHQGDRMEDISKR